MDCQESLHLDQLPVEILILIFDYCHAVDLARIAQVCTRFHFIAKDEFLWCRRAKRALATNQVSERFRERCNPLLCYRSKWQVTYNWEYGRYQRSIIISQNTKLMPWIQLTDNILWWSGGNQLCGFYRNNNQSDKVTNRIFSETNPNSDFCKFVVCDDHIVSGHRDGSIKLWMFELAYNGNRVIHSIEGAHSRTVAAVDETSDLILSGCAEGFVKAWAPLRRAQNMPNLPLNSIRVPDRVWSLKADPTGSKVAIGSAGNMGAPLFICDLENFSESVIINQKWRQGAGILDMVWENPSILMTGGYDSCVRKYDLRCGKCVGVWTDPTDATIYSLSSDYQYTFVTGTQFNCKSVLWDQRKPQYVQLYFMNLQRMSSPVYSISFDSCHLYGATDQTVVEVKFSGTPDIKKNYREIMNYKMFSSIG